MKKYSLLCIVFMLICAGTIQSQWVKLNGLTGLNVTSLLKFNNKLFAGTNPGKIHMSTDNGTTWTELTNGVTTANWNCLTSSGNNLIAGRIGGIITSTDGGTNWTTTLSSIYSVTQFLIVGTNIFAGHYDPAHGVLLSTNNGLNWTSLNVPTEISGIGFYGNTIFAGGFQTKLYASTDNGANWSLSNTGIPDSQIEGFITIGTNIYVSTYGAGVYVSTNGGSTWSKKGGNTWINSFAVSGANIFSGSGGNMGVSISKDNCLTWITINTGLTNMYVNYITIIDNYLYACTADGIFKRSIQEIASVDDYNIIPSSFSLEQNFPNPFNPSTVISYQVPVTGNVSLKVFDPLGREVIELVNEEKTAGQYEVKFDGANLSSGIYFYKIHAGDFIQIKKMILLK